MNEKLVKELKLEINKVLDMLNEESLMRIFLDIKEEHRRMVDLLESVNYTPVLMGKTKPTETKLTEETAEEVVEEIKPAKDSKKETKVETPKAAKKA